MARIVIAEDDAHIMRVITMWLKRQGHDVAEAGNGQVALELIVAEPPDVLITDINMPVMDGLTLLKELAEQQRLPRGIVVLTNRWDHKEIGEQIARQDVYVMPKPFSPTALAEVVQTIATAKAAAVEPSPGDGSA